MQTPSAQEIEREVAALRDIRRRSTQQGPGSIPLDPDLPPNSVASASAGGYWDNYSPTQTRSNLESPQAVGSAAAGSEDGEDGAEDPSHLFWVPAHLHPEIAPAEFRAFLKEHTTAHPDGGAPLSRALSRGSSLSRKRSMLSKQYNPSANDKVEDEQVVTVKRNRSSIYSNAGPQLTISDLQKLEELAEEAAQSDDPSKLRSVIRRSLSLNVAPSAFIDQMDDIPEGDDDNNPIIVPRPGQILRRTARTKIRKPGLVGDGGGHRFANTRRGAKSAKPDIEINSDNGHDSDTAYSEGTERPVSYTAESLILDMYGDRRDSTASANSSAEDDDLTSQQSHSTAPTSTPQSSSHGGSSQRPISPPAATSLSPPRGQTVRRVSPPPIQYPGEQQQIPFQLQQPPSQHSPQQAPATQLYHPTPRGHLDVPKQGMAPPSRTPSPSASDVGQPTPSTSPDPFRRSPSAPPPSSEFGYPSHTPSGGSPAASIRSVKSEKANKEKKGLLKGMWGGEKKKDRGAQERESREREAANKEKDSGFFGSLFGGGKKKNDEPEPGRGLLAGAGPAAAAALLGASKTRNQQGPLSPGLGGSFARYPIHVERAVYRLSHIKLANPRRPLYEQVLISNLMFWYLGVINKAATPAVAVSPATDEAPPANGVPNKEREQERLEKEKAEQEQRERVEREERDRQEREKEREAARERESQQKEQQTKKRGTLVKNMPPGSGPGQRRAEMPVRGPQYDVQHQIMQQETSPGAYPPMGRPMMRSNTTPVGEIYQPRGADPYQDPRPPRQQPPFHQYQQPPPPTPQPYQQQPPQQPYQPQPPYPNQPGYNPQQQQPYAQSPYTSQPGGYAPYGAGLPPGAMPPPMQGPTQVDQWAGMSNPRDPYAASGSIIPGPLPSIIPGPPPPPPGQGYSSRPMSPPKSQHPPQFNASGPSSPPGAPRVVGRSASASAAGPLPPPDFRQQTGPYPPAPPNGSWGPRPPTAPQQRRGPSPQPPPQGERRRRVSGGSENVAPGWQQQPAYPRGGPISR